MHYNSKNFVQGFSFGMLLGKDHLGEHDMEGTVMLKLILEQ
jgi:hypothetical protein